MLTEWLRVMLEEVERKRREAQNARRERAATPAPAPR